MKVFVTGGTGAIGRFAVPELLQAGHDVSALARSDQKAAQLEQQGATPARVSMFDKGALKQAFAGHDAVCNLATSIPPMAKAISPKSWAENDRIRREGSAAIVDAALAVGVGRLVQESITFTYPDRGDAWIDESVPIDPPPLGAAVAVAEENAARFTREGGTGVVLRFGLFYGPGSDHTDQFLKAARRHVAPVAGAGDAYQSSIHLADAATAVVAALALPAGIYNVTDDEPMTKRAYAKALGAAVGKRPWLSVPGRLIRAGGKQSEIMSRSQRVSNAAIKADSDWKPEFPSAREGWKAICRFSQVGPPAGR
jgi:nucleoside-diphosphate-sugar epimerase